MKYYDASTIHQLMDYKEFIPFLKSFFQSRITVPLRAHHNFSENTLLMMPAWNNQYLGTKLATVHPNNHQHHLPAIHATYLLQSAKTGASIAIFEGKSLTTKRTAAASALASSFLSREDSSTLLMIGNGALAPELIKAHATVRPIKNVLIWGRNPNKVDALIEKTDWNGLKVQRISKLEKAIQKADIISSATLSKTPLIYGEWLKNGQHLDLVGSYKPNMREADNTVLLKSKVYIDTIHAIKETGDLCIPIQEGIFSTDSIQSDLTQLCKNERNGNGNGNGNSRTNPDEITLFKSVGYALEDLAAAAFIVEKENQKI